MGRLSPTGKWIGRLYAWLMAALLTVCLAGAILEILRSTSGQVIPALQGIIQLDSFIVAGWTAGFFYFWKSVTVEARELATENQTLQRKLEHVNPQNNQVTEAMNTVASIQTMTKNFVNNLFIVGVISLGYFIGSGIVAVAGISGDDNLFLLLSLILMMIGFVQMLIGWSIVHDSTSQLGDWKSYLSSARLKFEASLQERS